MVATSGTSALAPPADTEGPVEDMGESLDRLSPHHGLRRDVMEVIKRAMLALLVTGFLVGLAGCDQGGTGGETDQGMERSGDQMDQGTQPGQQTEPMQEPGQQ
jgi:hypothetical protein